MEKSYLTQPPLGIWIAEDHPKNRAARIPGEEQSNQVAELSAILIALQNTDPYVPITFITDSKYAIDGLTKHLTRWEDTGWIGIANSKYIKATAYHLRRRSAQTSFIWVKGHSGQIGNERADQLAREGADKQTTDPIDLSVPNEFNLQGAKLSAITQALAYKGIRERKDSTQRRKTAINLEITRHTIKELTGHLENDMNIWNGCRNKDLNKKVRQFLFKAMHGAYRIGDYWLHIPTYEQRARCTHCNIDTESMEHILLECNNNARTTIWSLAKEMWPESFGARPRIGIGTILGCGNISARPPTPNDNEQTNPESRPFTKGASRLLRILISESAYLIWILRCDRTINGASPTVQAITKHWTTTINKRLQIDRITAKKIDRTPSFEKLVTATWKKVITSDKPIPKNWATALKVLVGIKPPRPSANEAPR
ncbi:RnaseH-domain-containing protein [Suillus plorans]|uniref:ribonuclease H n=1 Tax=Suillus plorans TaxID=116603 RepID=A0A9P7J0R6_9AGAM|nr:RnaseH-domain-containing protein [Suillus plorans]KAG1798240.1 RnaseH-domain-containing protein [Suillus plorans]